MIEIDKGVGGPNLRSQFLASDHIPGSLEQSGQNLQWLTLQPQSYTVFAQLPCADVQLKIIETQQARARLGGRHSNIRQS